MAWTNIVIDLEANDLLKPLVDFSSMPFKLKKCAELWCISLRCLDTDQSVLLVKEEFIGLQAPTLLRTYSTVVEGQGVVVHKAEGLNEKHEVVETYQTKEYNSNIKYETSISPHLKGLEYNSIPKRILTKDMVARVLQNCDKLIGHNIVAYDLPYLKLYGVLDYTIAYPADSSVKPYTPNKHTLNGRPVTIMDTLIISKLYNPDRRDTYGMHSLDAFGQRCGNEKIDFHDFSQYTWQMGRYCNGDTSTGASTYHYLMAEDDFSIFEIAYAMEIKLIDLTLKQEYFGFDFDLERAEKALVQLDQILKEREDIVLPLLPQKKLGVTEAKAYTPPKTQFKQNGDLAAAIVKFADKINTPETDETLDSEITSPDFIPDSLVFEPEPEYEIIVNPKTGKERKVKKKVPPPSSEFIISKPREDDPSAFDYYLLFEGKEFKLPFEEPVKEYTTTAINDHNVVKNYLISLGWQPSEYKERDLTKDSKKRSIDETKVVKAIQRYAKETMDGNFIVDRLDYLGLKHDTCPPVNLEQFLLDKYYANPSRALKVITTPPLRVGAEKSLCPNLEKLAKKTNDGFIKAIVEWHTYTHRRNSIAGGTVDEDGEPTKGFISFIREDGRVSTPADTMGAATFRYLHRDICNIPRNTSLFGDTMRALFGAGEGYVQLGYDYSSLEAVVQCHFIIPFEGGAELGKSLTAEKPNSIHCINARRLGIDRSDAKAISYALLYGAAPQKLMKMLGLSEEAATKMWNEYWDAVAPLRDLRDKLTSYWESVDKDHIPGIDGRKIRVRKAHALINSMFQSTGAIMAKWCTVRTAQHLEELDLLGDPFVHTKEDVKIFQMIAYHDECQYALHRSLIKVKSFFDPKIQEEWLVTETAYKQAMKEWKAAGSNKETKPEDVKNPFEAQAEQWIKDNPIEGQYSAIGHLVEGPYAGLHYVSLPNVLSTTILESIDNVVKEHKFRVPLGMEWITGRNWRDCH